MANFKLTWGWGSGKEFETHRELMRWRSENEDNISSIFDATEYVRGFDGNWYELATDICAECVRNGF